MAPAEYRAMLARELTFTDDVRKVMNVHVMGSIVHWYAPLSRLALSSAHGGGVSSETSRKEGKNMTNIAPFRASVKMHDHVDEDFRAQYERDGFAVLSAALTPTEVAALNADAVQICR